MAIDREKTLVAAQKYVDKKKYDKAVVEYQKVIQEDPNDARTLLKMGDLQSRMEDYAAAIGSYERVGRFYASQGFSLKAIAVYKQIQEIVTKRVPQLEETYAHITPTLAELYQQLGLTGDALAALDEVATRLQRQGRDPEAIDVFRKIVELDQTNPLPHLRLAEGLSRVKDADGAVAEFSIAAGQLAKIGRRDDALKVIERLLLHKPEPTQARVAAELYLARNASNDGLHALAKLQIAFQVNPRDLDTLSLLARAFNHIGQAAKAIEVQKEMARIARDTGKFDLFREIIGRLSKLVPNDEAVRQLAAMPIGTSSVPPPQPSAREVPAARPDDSLEDEYEDVEESAIDEERPIELSRRAGRPHSNADDVVEADGDRERERERLAQVLSDAATFRRARLPTKAIATLRTALVAAPRSTELREVLRDVLLETGQQQQAVVEMMELAELQIEELDADEAVRTLQDALAIDPQHVRAAEMLRALGYELVEEPVQAATMDQGMEPSSPETTDRESYTALGQTEETSSGNEDPLPSYNLDEIDEPDVVLPPRTERFARPTATRQPGQGSTRRLDEIDDPFAPLPSFPLEASTEAGAGVRPPPRGVAELESALEEADFFATRGLYDDARTILHEQLARLPNHPLLLERMMELNAQEHGAQVGSGTRPSPAAGNVEDRAFDIAESLGALDAIHRPDHSEASSEPKEQVDVEEVFAKFKEGVAKQIGADDAQSHYDLGLAYKDMGLLDDAAREFETAARDPRRACVCHSMIGMIHFERGNINEAIDSLLRGLQAPERTKEQEAALSYEVGAAYEVKKMHRQALDYFQRAARLIPGFRDVVDRVRHLQKIEAVQPARAVAVGADDEFDRAFADILGKG